MGELEDELRALRRVAFIARMVAGQARPITVHGGGMWDVTQSTMTSLRGALAGLDEVAMTEFVGPCAQCQWSDRCPWCREEPRTQEVR